jgi:excisionase family DNA binding protein
MTFEHSDTFTTSQVADLLGLHPQVVRLMAREGRLPSHRPEGQRAFVFLTAEVLAWLRAHPVGRDTS